MNTYEQAYQQAQQMKAFGATSAELLDRAQRFDDNAQYSAGAAFRHVAGE